MSEPTKPPNYDKAVLGFCELLALVFGLPPGDDLYHGTPLNWRSLTFLAIGGAFAFLGPAWPLLKARIPRRLSVSIVRTASEFRFWLGALFLLFIFAMGPDLYRQALSPDKGTIERLEADIAALKTLPPGAPLSPVRDDAASLNAASQISTAPPKAEREASATYTQSADQGQLKTPTVVKILFGPNPDKVPPKEMDSENVMWQAVGGTSGSNPTLDARA
jgi:hypothetical protein